MGLTIILIMVMKFVTQEGLNDLFPEHYIHIFGTSDEHRVCLNWEDHYPNDSWYDEALEAPFT